MVRLAFGLIFGVLVCLTTDVRAQAGFAIELLGKPGRNDVFTQNAATGTLLYRNTLNLKKSYFLRRANGESREILDEMFLNIPGTIVNSSSVSFGGIDNNDALYAVSCSEKSTVQNSFACGKFLLSVLPWDSEHATILYQWDNLTSTYLVPVRVNGAGDVLLVKNQMKGGLVQFEIVTIHHHEARTILSVNETRRHGVHEIFEVWFDDLGNVIVKISMQNGARRTKDIFYVGNIKNDTLYPANDGKDIRIFRTSYIAGFASGKVAVQDQMGKIVRILDSTLQNTLERIVVPRKYFLSVNSINGEGTIFGTIQKDTVAQPFIRKSEGKLRLYQCKVEQIRYPIDVSFRTGNSDALVVTFNDSFKTTKPGVLVSYGYDYLLVPIQSSQAASETNSLNDEVVGSCLEA